jgi:hypothetical protein
MERLSQALGREPKIKDSDLAEIKSQYADSNPPADAKLTKRDIQRILRSLNAKHKSKRYTTCYLEKWRSIRAFLTGEEETEEDVGIVRLGYIFKAFSDKWDEMTMEEGRFPERRHFPNFNFMFNQIIRLPGIKVKVNPSNFPMPSRKCSERLMPYFLAMALELNILTPDDTTHFTTVLPKAPNQ